MENEPSEVIFLYFLDPQMLKYTYLYIHTSNDILFSRLVLHQGTYLTAWLRKSIRFPLLRLHGKLQLENATDGAINVSKPGLVSHASFTKK